MNFTQHFIETATTTCIVVDYEVETTKGTISHLKIAGKECIEIGLTLSEIKEEIKMHKCMQMILVLFNNSTII